MLEMQYGNLENCPKTISGKLLEKEVGSLTEDLRRRMRYLCHLPVTCQFEIAEIELNTPTISEEVLEFFAGIFLKLFFIKLMHFSNYLLFWSKFYWVC